MKRLLQLFFICIFSNTVIAQTTWIGNGVDTNWNTTANWSSNGVPDADDDIIIPTGFTVTLNVTGTIKSIDIQGDSVFEMNANLIFSEPSTIGANATVNWASGRFYGTMSTLTNLGTINTTTTSIHFIEVNTTLDNQGTLNITSSGDLYIVGSESTLNNPIGGIIDMQADSGNISYHLGIPGVFNNEGLIKKTTSTGEARITHPINNNDGIIQVEVGTLSFLDAIGTGKNFTDGTYNVFAGATMDWDTTINPSGTIEGTIAGNLNWNNTVNIPTDETVIFNFSSTDNFNWVSGTLNGGGTLINANVLNLTTNAIHFIDGSTTLDNQGTLNITSSGDLYIVGSESTLHNPLDGIIDMQADSGNIAFHLGIPGVFNNEGLIKKTTSTGEARISHPINNNNGTIQVEVGTLSILNAIGTGKNFIDGTYNVFAGATMDWDTTINPSGTLEGTITGNLNWNDTVNIPTGETATFNFSATDNFNWVSGTLTGGGTLINANVINTTTATRNFIDGGTMLDNQGTLNITSSGDLVIVGSGSILNNPLGGVIDLQADSGNIAYHLANPGVFNNAGLIKKTTSSGEAQISHPINNNNGTLQVEVGTLSIIDAFGTGKNFTDGMYNVFAGASMDWDTTINPSGILEGTIVGNLNWNNTVYIPTGETATFNFLPTDSFNWTAGSLNGGGTLINTTVLKTTTTANHFILGGTMLDNQGVLNITSAGRILLSGTESVLYNSEDGIIDMQADGGDISWSATSGVLNNAGLIKRTTTTGLAQIIVELNNSGTIQLETGELEITSNYVFTNEATGVVKGIGVFDLPNVTNYINNGTFAPGLSPGTLNIQGDYKSSSTSILDVELDGLVAGTEYDVLAITGTNVEFDGIVNVTLGFEPSINDEFIIATTTGTISICNITNTVSADYNGNTYTFDVFCRNDNELVLGVNNITLGLDENELNNAVSLYPNPVKNEFVINNNGSIQLSNALLLDVNGRLIEKINLEEMHTEKQISISNYEAGLYLIQINSERGSIVKRIIKQ